MPNMEWSNDFTLEFLEAYRSERVLWDPTHEQHKDKRRLNDAWVRISKELDHPVSELKRKKDSLMATFRAHLRKKKDSMRSGASEKDMYKPVWFAYDFMEEFLAPVYGIGRNFNKDDSVEERKYEALTGDEEEEGAQYELAELMTVGGSRAPRPSASASRQRAEPPPIKRLKKNPPELQDAFNQMKEVFNKLEKACSKTREREREEDECDLFGKMVATKLRKFKEEERELVMYEIDGIFVNRRLNRPNE